MSSQPPLTDAELEQLRRQGLFAGAQAMTDLSGDILKWTIASLLVVNGGALVALLGANDLRTKAFEEAAYFFGGGMLAALFGGVLWNRALSLFAADGLRRAWDGTALTATELDDLATKSSKQKWTLAADLTWWISFGLFAIGCIRMAYVPQLAQLERLGAEHREASAKSSREAERTILIFKDRRSTPEQKQAALDQYRAADLESRLRAARIADALGEPDTLMNELQNSFNEVAANAIAAD